MSSLPKESKILSLHVQMAIFVQLSLPSNLHLRIAQHFWCWRNSAWYRFEYEPPRSKRVWWVGRLNKLHICHLSFDSPFHVQPSELTWLEIQHLMLHIKSTSCRPTFLDIWSITTFNQAAFESSRECRF